MKRTLYLILAIFLALLLSACSDEPENPPVSAGYLPTRLEQILTDPVVPEGSEAKIEPVSGDYTVESFWGEWVRKDADSEEAYANDPVFNYMVTAGREEPLELEFSCFPESFSFMPDYATSPLGFGNIKTSVRHNNVGSFGLDLPDDDVQYEHHLLGLAFSELGLGFGTISYQFSAKPMDTADLFASLTENMRTVTYAVNENVLSVGLTDVTAITGSPGYDVPDQTGICEIDYIFSWTGMELTLTYDGQSAIYVPRVYEGGSEWKLADAGTIIGMEPLDGMLGITLDDEQTKVMYERHSGYTDSEIMISNDGTMEIDGRLYTYAYSGQSLTITGEDGTAVYSNYSFLLESFNNPTFSSFIFNGSQIRLSGDTTVGWFVEQGFKTDLDLNQPIVSCQVTDAFRLYYGNDYVTVKACNVFNYTLTLAECVVCDVVIDCDTDAISKGDGKIGHTTYERAEEFFAPAYEKKPDYLRYKTSYRGISWIPHLWGPDVGKKLAVAYPEDAEVIYRFDDSILQQVEILVPALMYNGLQDNVDDALLESMDAVTMQGFIENRDTVLDRLKAAFDQAGVAVDINESTGEIVMSSSVLFGYDSSDLSAEGQAYIDSFMGVYAEVILDESLDGVISKIQLEGHTDSSGSYNYNLTLSEKRAQAVLDYCLSSSFTSMNRDQKEKLSKIVDTVGYAFSDLVYDSNGEEDAEASRRVAIKFYVTENPVEKTAETPETVPMGELSADDFILTHNGQVYDVVEAIGSKAAWYFYFDESRYSSRNQVVETARGIHIGDSVNDLFAAYGVVDVYAFHASNPLYNADDYRSAMLDECVSYVSYFYGDTAAVFFLLDDWNCVSWIVYYVD